MSASSSQHVVARHVFVSQTTRPGQFCGGVSASCETLAIASVTATKFTAFCSDSTQFCQQTGTQRLTVNSTSDFRKDGRVLRQCHVLGIQE